MRSGPTKAPIASGPTPPTISRAIPTCRIADYLGAAGVAWALDVLARDGLAPSSRGWPSWPTASGGVSPGAGVRRGGTALLVGESGILLAAESIRRDGEHLDALEACIRRNARNPALELLWGSPGTMLAALELWRRTGDERWRDAWLESADCLLGEWRDTVWEQDLYGSKRHYVGAAHGFAGNAFALLAGADLLGDRAGAVRERVAGVFRELAVEQDGLAQWFPRADAEPVRPAVQWCHGSPGLVTSLAALPADEETDRLLAAGGELTWRAGPLVKGVGLCHGTAGNAYPFLALHARARGTLAGTGPRVRDGRRRRRRAAPSESRSRPLHALHGRHRRRAPLRSCLTGDATFPFIGVGGL